MQTARTTAGSAPQQSGGLGRHHAQRAPPPCAPVLWLDRSAVTLRARLSTASCVRGQRSQGSPRAVGDSGAGHVQVGWMSATRPHGETCETASRVSCSTLEVRMLGECAACQLIRSPHGQDQLVGRAGREALQTQAQSREHLCAPRVSSAPRPARCYASDLDQVGFCLVVLAGGLCGRHAFAGEARGRRLAGPPEPPSASRSVRLSLTGGGCSRLTFSMAAAQSMCGANAVMRGRGHSAHVRARTDDEQNVLLGAVPCALRNQPAPRHAGTRSRARPQGAQGAAAATRTAGTQPGDGRFRPRPSERARFSGPRCAAVMTHQRPQRLARRPHCLHRSDQLRRWRHRRRCGNSTGTLLRVRSAVGQRDPLVGRDRMALAGLGAMGVTAGPASCGARLGVCGSAGAWGGVGGEISGRRAAAAAGGNGAGPCSGDTDPAEDVPVAERASAPAVGGISGGRGPKRFRSWRDILRRPRRAARKRSVGGDRRRLNSAREPPLLRLLWTRSLAYSALGGSRMSADPYADDDPRVRAGAPAGRAY
jgi:hypothetical protein